MRQNCCVLLAGLLMSGVLGGCKGPLISDPDAMAVVPPPGVDARNARVRILDRPIRPGEAVPALAWMDQMGREVTTLELVTAGDALLIFTPGDVSTTRPVYDWVRRQSRTATANGVEVLIVSPDSVDRNAEIAAHEQLRVALLSDPNSWGARAFGLAPKNGATIRQPWSVVIGKEGRVLLCQPGLVEMPDLVTAVKVRAATREGDFKVMDMLR